MKATSLPNKPMVPTDPTQSEVDNQRANSCELG